VKISHFQATGLFIGILALAACGSDDTPDAAYMSRDTCVVWAGQCQRFPVNGHSLTKSCEAKKANTAKWTREDAATFIFDCSGKDGVTGQSMRVSFVLHAIEQNGVPLAQIQRAVFNGRDLRQAEMIDLIPSLMTEEDRKR
jgi:hypothetical protein